MSKPLTMTVEQEKADRAASRFMDRCGMAEAGSADAAALRAWTEVDALRAALADERRHADALDAALMPCPCGRCTHTELGSKARLAHAARRAANAPLSDAGASSEVANGTA